MHRVLALGSNYEPVGTISWKKAVSLVFSNKAMTLAEYDEEIKSPSYKMKLPSVVVYKYNKRKMVVSVRFSRKNVWLRDEGKCQYCNINVSIQNFTLDHIIPKCYGGKTTWENVVTCCYACNQKKGEKTLKEVGFKLNRQAKKPTSLPIISEARGYYGSDNFIHPSWSFWLGKQ
jgi:5-methylcytosine-specific restriction endonuclease McrA